MSKGGRPSKYNWEAIKDAYEKGFDKDDIVKKFKINKKLLTDKINKDKWTVLSDVNSDINEFTAQSLKMAENYSKHPEVEDLFIEKINTQALDNELITNNRKLAKMLQGVIISSRNDITLRNIKAVSATLKDIESIANPTAARMEINNSNSMQESNQPMQIIIQRDN